MSLVYSIIFELPFDLMDPIENSSVNRYKRFVEIYQNCPSQSSLLENRFHCQLKIMKKKRSLILP
jgi:hypothetical protein